MSISVKNSLLNANQIYYITFKWDQDFSGDLIVKTNLKGHIPQIAIKKLFI